jgi:hypothetical protein
MSTRGTTRASIGSRVRHTGTVFGRPPRRKLGPHYDLYATVIAALAAAGLFIGVMLWALALG